MTKFGTMPDQGDIVLIPIPFTDLSSVKRRPVVVLSNNGYNQKSLDVVVVALTSNLTSTGEGFLITSNDLEKGTLPKDSRIRTDKIYTLSQKIILNRFGKIKPEIIQKIKTALNDIL